MEEEVTGKDIDICLSACLGVYAVGDVAEIAEYVEAVYDKCQALAGQSVADSCVPYEIVRIQFACGVTPAREDCEIGGDLEVRRQLIRTVDTIVQIHRVEAGEPCHGAEVAVKRAVEEDGGIQPGLLVVE